MSIFNYKVLNPTTDKKKPFLDKNGFFYFYIKEKNIKYYLECVTINTEKQIKEYYLLVGENKFDEHCKLCHVDDYGRCKFKPRGELKDYIVNEMNDRGNLNVIKTDSNGLYVTFLIE